MVYDLLMWFPEPLRFPVAMAMLLSVVPITGLMVFGGNWRQAWQYTKTWLCVVGAMVATAAVISLALYPFMT